MSTVGSWGAWMGSSPSWPMSVPWGSCSKPRQSCAKRKLSVRMVTGPETCSTRLGVRAGRPAMRSAPKSGGTTPLWRRKPVTQSLATSTDSASQCWPHSTSAALRGEAGSAKSPKSRMRAPSAWPWSLTTMAGQPMAQPRVRPLSSGPAMMSGSVLCCIEWMSSSRSTVCSQGWISRARRISAVTGRAGSLRTPGPQMRLKSSSTQREPSGT